ncbi:hypothetical protein TcBrA4_0073920 [Trypanosoma cruzi]|nr:hypothetical protein TcBrA4_0073920 [Trypanosoma cruzi]
MTTALRYRLGNVQESEFTRARRLINSHDPLSTQEQVQVLHYLAASMRSSVTLLRVVAVLQIFLAFLFIAMLTAGHPLVYAVIDDAPPLTFGGAVAIMKSSILLVAGGLYDMRTCRRTLYIDEAALVETNPGREQETGVHAGRRDACTAALVVTEPPRYHYFLGFLALWPTVYWLYVMRVYHTHMAQQGPVFFGVADNWVELVLVLWQPVMHFVFARTLSSIVTGKNDLLRLAKMKYRYDKL